MIYFLLFLSSLGLTYMIKNYAIKKSLLAEVNERSSHSVPTPHGGGIALAITWFVGLVYLYMYEMINQDIFYALLVGVVISVVSFFDDIFDLSAKFRILVQVFVACLGLYFLGGLNSVLFIENQIVTNLFAILLVIWFINLYNFLDGIDGYAGSEAIFLGVAGFILFQSNLFLVLIASVAGFLVWNWHKAKIFMGDVGSTLLGYNIAIFTIYYSNQEPTNLWIWIMLFGLFWFDATLTLFRRYKNKEKLSQAHKKHAYQRLTQSGWSHSKVVIYSIIVNIVLFCLVFFISNIILAFLISLIVLYFVVKFIDRKKIFI
ncbi:MraY family glycosyltransferase [Sulfurospirillum arcachonense]|uniref:MraY family glycosyltransferase n=1 Tax=Sulfurospirillum arcachonense TaxID=57666 RepID=UPI000469D44C|nr:glycosyltransferase family 4 protein [Sulfurospirillum arcachonense]